MRFVRFAALALIAASASACAQIKDATKGPELTPMGYPAALTPRDQQITALARDEPPSTASANSLWRAGARTFFADQRAGRVGDILTVTIDIDDSASTSNTTSTSRSSSADLGVSHLFGLESSLSKLFPSAFDPTNAIGTKSDTSNAGAGAIDRKDKISLTVAAVVTKVLPNGNMVIQGSQEVRTNAEVRQLTVAGIVRPEDITSDNTIKHTQIAEARISYAGRGDLSRVQKTPAGQALIEQFSPF